MSPDDQPNLPAVPEPQLVHKTLEIPVAEFEGEMVRVMVGKIPAMELEMDYGYARGTHVKVEMEFRVRSVMVDEQRGRNAGDLKRVHTFALEEARIIGAYTADQLDPGVGGGLAVGVEDSEQEMDEHPELEGAAHGTPDTAVPQDIPDF